MKLSAITDGESARFNFNLQIDFPILGQLIHIRNDAKSLPDLVRDIFQQLFDIFHADNITGIINTYINGAALGIGKAVHPLQEIGRAHV